MPYPLLAQVPAVVGMYASGRIEHNVPVPAPGVAVNEAYLGTIDPATVETVMAARKAAFEADQVASNFHRARMEPVGYTVNGAGGVTAYYQIVMPWYAIHPLDKEYIESQTP